MSVFATFGGRLVSVLGLYVCFESFLELGCFRQHVTLRSHRFLLYTFFRGSSGLNCFCCANVNMYLRSMNWDILTWTHKSEASDPFRYEHLSSKLVRMTLRRHDTSLGIFVGLWSSFDDQCSLERMSWGFWGVQGALHIFPCCEQVVNSTWCNCEVELNSFVKAHLEFLMWGRKWEASDRFRLRIVCGLAPIATNYGDV